MNPRSPRHIINVMDFYSKAAEFASLRQPFATATVVRVEGSSSARRGSKALIDFAGKIVLGWVGGGCAESAVRSEALNCIRSGQPTLITLDMQDEVLGVGMPCGGIMDVYIEPVLPQPELVIAGHGRIAETLAGLGHLMNFSVTVHDPQADRVSFPHAERMIDKDFDVTQIAFGPRTYVVIATLHKNDHLWLQRALEGEAAYVALVASAHRSRLVLDYLLAEGMPPEKVERVWAPAGLDLAPATPEEIALSIMSQIVALRRGGTAAPRKETVHAAEGQHTRSATSDKVIRQCDVGKTE
ncbi:MAG TPA: XdhC family protein [Candidatus Angelobacter sp.]|nr:XdhC family protein [Candidatus Angelobacter sp.]